MKLLILTQKVDKEDDNLGAFYYWFEACARRAESVVIIANAVGFASFPPHVSVYSLGKEHGFSRLKRIWRFLVLFSRHYARADAVLFHQIPEFVVAAAPFLISLKKPSALWYAHKSVTWKLRLAEKLVSFVFTSSCEGFRIHSKKVVVVGQAIDTERFSPGKSPLAHPSALRLVTIGRISSVKNYEALIRACAELKKTWGRQWVLTIAGGPLLPKDSFYLDSLKMLVSRLGLDREIVFLGPLPYREIPDILRDHDLFVNLSRTGSMDKAVLEAMAVGLSVLTSNEAYRDILPPQYFLVHQGPEFLAGRIKNLADESRPNLTLRRIVVERHAFEKTVGRMMDTLSESLASRGL